MTDEPQPPTAAQRRVFGQRVKTLREAHGLSQEKLAELADVHRTYLSNLDRDERNVGLDNINAIAEALGVPTAELFVQA